MSSKLSVASLGEILWDVFPTGPRFGGAPANLACSLAALGGEEVDVAMVSAVGRDELGDRALDELTARNVGVQYTQRSERPTGNVQVSVDAEGVASYEFAADTAWDDITWSADLETYAGEVDAVCLGTLGQRSETSRETIRRFVRSTPASALRVLDVNLRPPFDDRDIVLASLELASFLKLSDEELPKLSAWCDLHGTPAERLRALADRFELRGVALTRGADGAMILRGDELDECDGYETDLVDTVGAGDSFTATLVLGLLREWSLERIGQLACRVAAFVCSREGATPPFPSELVEAARGT